MDLAHTPGPHGVGEHEQHSNREQEKHECDDELANRAECLAKLCAKGPRGACVQKDDEGPVCKGATAK